MKTVAYLHVLNIEDYYNHEKNDGTFSFLDEEVGLSAGNFIWLTNKYKHWFSQHNYQPDLLYFNGKYYLFGENGNDKSTLNDLKKIKIKIK